MEEARQNLIGRLKEHLEYMKSLNQTMRPIWLSQYETEVFLKVITIPTNEVLEKPDPKDNPLTDDDDWIHDVDMGAR